MLTNIVLVMIGLFGLFIGGNWLVKGASRIATSFGISTLIIGLTIVAIGTSAPELLVSISAALRGSSGIAVGNVVGSNIANIGLILGITGLIAPIMVQAVLIRREIPIMLVVSIFAYLLVLDGALSRLDGVLLLFGFIVFNGAFYFLARQEAEEAEAEEAARIAAGGESDVPDDGVNLPLEVGRVIVGVGLLVLGADSLVNGASEIARSFGISELVIGITMVAFGTSLPELATGVAAAMKNENDIVVGNIIGSNIANILLILGATAFILPIEIDPGLTQFEFVVMLLFSFALLPFAWNRVVSRRESALFFGAYIAFIVYSFLVN